MVVVVGVFVAVVVVLKTKTQLVPLVLTCGRNGFGDNSNYGVYRNSMQWQCYKRKHYFINIKCKCTIY